MKIIIEIDKVNYTHKVLNSDQPVIVDVWA